MKVSVFMVTYNHERFIAQAVESVLRQEVDFDYEVVIGEDCSTDRTREIVLELQTEHPDKICVLLADKNMGGAANTIRTLRACCGEYIALLEGDDYWISSEKLRRQVEYMDANPGCAFCFHNGYEITEGDNATKTLFHRGVMKERYSIDDLLDGNFIRTCSVLFRAGLFTEFPKWHLKATCGDWPMHIMNARHGWIGYLPEVMSVYRRHRGGVWSLLSSQETVGKLIWTARRIRPSLKREKRKRLDNTIVEWHMAAISIAFGHDDCGSVAKFSRNLLLTYFFRKDLLHRYLIKCMVIGYVRCCWRLLVAKIKLLFCVVSGASIQP